MVVGVNTTPAECEAARKKSGSEVYCQDAVRFVGNDINIPGKSSENKTMTEKSDSISGDRLENKIEKVKSASTKTTWLSDMMWSIVTPILTRDDDNNDFVLVRNSESESDAITENSDTLDEKDRDTKSVSDSEDKKLDESEKEANRAISAEAEKGFDAVVVVDAMYHFDTRIDCFRNLNFSHVLRKGGRVAAVDILGAKMLATDDLGSFNLSAALLSPFRVAMLYIVALAAGAPLQNLIYDEPSFQKWCTGYNKGNDAHEGSGLSFIDYRSRDITDEVLPGFASYAWNKAKDADSLKDKIMLSVSSLFMNFLYTSGLVRVHLFGMTKA